MNTLECNCQWHFAKQPVAGQVIGPNNAAVEHFKDTPYPSLIRESIQNSLDAIADPEQPLRMRFEFGKLRSKTFEGFYGLRDHIDGVIKRFGEKAEKEYAPMLKQFDQSYMNGQCQLHYIKVSDFNTKGMNYDDSGNSPFHAFMRALGLTIKDEDYSGGSFGFGKSAYFMMSPIHTVLVSTMTLDKKTYFEGAASLCTHLYPDENGKLVEYQHYGYYDNQDGMRPASLPTDIPNKFRREETGTDIYIMGVDGSDEKQATAIDEMIKATLRHFWMAILQKKLIVEIGDLTIDVNTLDELMGQHFPDKIDKMKSKDNYNPYPYYLAVKNSGQSKDFICINRKLDLLGDVSLYVWKCKDARDSIIHMRKQCMYIYRARFYSASYGYYAVFICTDNRGNKLLQSIEDPSHRKWESQRSPDGKRIMDEIETFITNCLEELFVQDGDGPLGVTRLEEFLFVPEKLIASDKNDFEDNPFFGEQGEGTKEEGTSPTTIIESPTPTIPDDPKTPLGKVVITTNKGGKRDPKGKLGGHTRSNKGKKRKGKGNNPDLSGFTPTNDGTPGRFLENIPVTYRVVAEQKKGKMIHSILIKSDFDVENAQIEIVVGGEENDETIGIVASSMGVVKGNKVTNLTLHKNTTNIVELTFADQMKHTIKLTAYEFK